MDATKMQALVETHIQAEGRGDVDGAVSVYTDDIEHDVVGFPTAQRKGSTVRATSTPTSPRTFAPNTKTFCIGTLPTTR
jgi:hypothetical protein